jgi:hypothetical protein
MRSRAPVTVALSVNVATGWGVHMASTHARSFSFTRNTAAGTGFIAVSPFSTNPAIASRTGCEALTARLSPFAGRKASRNTIEPIASRICSATPEITTPP